MGADGFDRHIAVEDLTRSVAQEVPNPPDNIGCNAAVRNLASRHRDNLAIEIFKAFFRMLEQFDVFLDGVFVFG